MTFAQFEPLEGRVLFSAGLMSDVAASAPGDTAVAAVTVNDDASQVADIQYIDFVGIRYVDVGEFLGLNVVDTTVTEYKAYAGLWYQLGWCSASFPRCTAGGFYTISTFHDVGPDGEFWLVKVTGGDLESDKLILIENDQATLVSGEDWKQILCVTSAKGKAGGVVKGTDGKFRTFRLVNGELTMGEAWDSAEITPTSDEVIYGRYTINGRSHHFLFDCQTGIIIEPWMPQGAEMSSYAANGKGLIAYGYVQGGHEYVALWYKGETKIIYRSEGECLYYFGFNIDDVGEDKLCFYQEVDGVGIDTVIDIRGYQGGLGNVSITITAASDEQSEDAAQADAALSVLEDEAADEDAQADATDAAAQAQPRAAQDEEARDEDHILTSLATDLLQQVRPMNIRL